MNKQIFTNSPQEFSTLNQRNLEKNVTDIFARTLYGDLLLDMDEEGRGLLTNVRIIESCAKSILNRVQSMTCEGQDIDLQILLDHCLDIEIFNCWNPHSPKFQILLSLNLQDPKFKLCLRIASRCLHDALNDNIKGATHYHRKDDLPAWAKGRPAIAEVSDYWFYRLQG